jgi:hypothetical protein
MMEDKKDRISWFPIRMSGGLFLIIQAIFLQFLWGPVADLRTAGPAALTFTILTLLALLAAIGFFLLRHIGWLIAMIVQGACLFAALVLHFGYEVTSETELTMVYSILMVLYLNSFIVRTAFGAKVEDEEVNLGADE